MHLLILLVCVAEVAFGANTQGLSLDQISRLIANNMDANGDGQITFDEMYQDMISKYDDDNNKCISQTEFVNQWRHEYHDDRQSSEAFYKHLDLSNDGCLNRTELQVHYRVMDHNVDGILTFNELKNYMHVVHPDRVGHGHNGHHG